jgi:hypothetical protein
MSNTYEFEYTDTFGGEANYCWVKRGFLYLQSISGEGAKARASYDAMIKRKAKARVGLTGVRGRWDDFGDGFAFYPRGMCTVLFVTWHDCPGDHCDCAANQARQRGFDRA